MPVISKVGAEANLRRCFASIERKSRAAAFRAAQTTGSAANLSGENERRGKTALSPHAPLGRFLRKQTQARAAAAVDLIKRALPRGFVRTPANKLRAVAKAAAREMIVFHFDDQL
jgi:hypothetical protein